MAKDRYRQVVLCRIDRSRRATHHLFLATVPSYVLWALGLIAVISVALFIWRRRLDAAREKAWVGEFSFGDVVGRMKARDALDRAREPGTLTAASASSAG